MHIYTKNNKLYPSVTTVVGYFKPLETFESLMKWSNFLGFKHKDYIKERDNKAAFGTAVHETVAGLLTNTPVDKSVSDSLTINYLADYADAIKYFERFMMVEMIHPIDTIFSEETIVSEKLGYAGTIDWLGTYKNKTFLFDFKTSSSMHETMKLQLSAYRKLLKEERDITIDGAAIVFISKKGVTLQEVSLDELDKVYKKFEVMLQLFELYRDDLIIEPDDLIQCDLTNP
jgi:CRISPR/Cas system-associated exonuclease Cas4 (RecB family)